MENNSKKYGYPTGFKLDENSIGYLTKEQIQGEGWVQSEPSPNGYLFYFEKVMGKHGNAKKWKLKYYQHNTYLAPLEIEYFIENEPFAYDGYAGWSSKFEFQCYSLEDFKKLSELLVI